MRQLSIKYFFLALMAALSASATVSCSPQKLMVKEFVRVVEKGLPAVEQEDDLNMLANAMPANIKLLETLSAGDPRNQNLLVLLSRLYGGYAFAVLESELEARRLDRPSVVDAGIPENQLDNAVARYFQTGAEYALRCLEIRYPRARVQLNHLQSSGGFISALDTRDVPALFWYAFNLGGFIQHRADAVEAIAKAHLVEKSMQRVVELDENYYHGNAHLALLVYYASRPPMMGGNPELARRHYQRHARMQSASARLRELYWGRYMLVQQQEKAAFVRHLSAVAQAPGEGHPFSLLDKVAAVRAGIYLDAVDHFFD